jgi:hypothetical protein
MIKDQFDEGENTFVFPQGRALPLYPLAGGTLL